jgi:hypothetical protein
MRQKPGTSNCRQPQGHGNSARDAVLESHRLLRSSKNKNELLRKQWGTPIYGTGEKRRKAWGTRRHPMFLVRDRKAESLGHPANLSHEAGQVIFRQPILQRGSNQKRLVEITDAKTLVHSAILRAFSIL